MKKAIPYILIIMGLLLILTPVINKLFIKYFYNNMDIDSISLDDINKNTRDKEIVYDFDAVEDINLSESLLGAMDFDKNQISGLLYIPDLNMKLPISEGLSNSALLAGAGTMKENQEMGKGNYSLAGHNMKDKSLLFGSLMDVKDGSLAYISDGKYIYEYQIKNTKIVPDTEFSMISDDKVDDKPLLSLMTCYQTSKSGKRFFAIGELVNTYTVEEGKNIID